MAVVAQNRPWFEARGRDRRVNWTDACSPCKEFQRLGHEVRMKLKHRAVSGIGIDDEFAVRKTSRQIVRVLTWNHAITISVGN
jgi:hypothetical protein